MIDQSAQQVANQRKKSPGKFYIIGCSSAERQVDFEVENLHVLEGAALFILLTAGEVFRSTGKSRA